jgi:hypothetical protein
MNFDTAFHKLLGHEGAYSDHPSVPKRRGDLLHGLTAAQPELYCVSTAPKNRGPLRKRFVFAAEFVPVCSPKVVGLFNWRCPSDVSRFISAVIVYTINGFPRGRFAHVFKERFKTVQPLIANLYAASAPKVISSALRVVAAIFHGCPCRVGSAFPKSVCTKLIGNLFIVKTSTGSGSAAAEFVCSHKSSFPAVTYALPASHWATVSVGSTFSSAMNNQTTKSLA